MKRLSFRLSKVRMPFREEEKVTISYFQKKPSDDVELEMKFEIRPTPPGNFAAFSPFMLFFRCVSL